MAIEERTARPGRHGLASPPDADRRRLRQPRGLRGGARAPLLPRLVLHRPVGRGPGGRRLPGPRHRGRIGLRRPQPRRRAPGLLQRLRPRGTKLLDDEPACGNLGKALKCPYHAWSYDLDGRLLATPNVHEDEQFERADYRLSQVGVGEHGGFLFVSLAEAPVPLDAWLRNSNETITDFDRYRLGELQLARRITYDVAANWKIVVENYNECLHCPQIHPELVQVIPLYRKGEVWDGETRDGGNEMAPGASSFTATGTSDLPKFPDLLPRGLRHVLRGVPVPEPDGQHASRFGDGLPRVPERPGPDDRRLRVLLPTRSAGDAGLRSRARPSTSGTSSAARTGRSASAPSSASRRGRTSPASIRARTACCSTSTSAGAASWGGRSSADLGPQSAGSRRNTSSARSSAGDAEPWNSSTEPMTDRVVSSALPSRHVVAMADSRRGSP